MIRPLEKPQNKYWLTFALCGLAAALMFLPFYIVDKGFFCTRETSTASRSPFIIPPMNL